MQYILHIHFSDSAVYTTGTLQIEGSILYLQCNGILPLQCIHCTLQYTSVSVQCTLYSALTVYASPNRPIMCHFLKILISTAGTLYHSSIMIGSVWPMWQCIGSVSKAVYEQCTSGERSNQTQAFKNVKE